MVTVVQRRRLEELVGPDEGEIASEDRRAGAEPLAVAVEPIGFVREREPPAGDGPPTTCERPVHDVVVQQGEGVQHLDGRGQLGDGGLVIGAAGAVAPVHERGPKALAARGHQVGDLTGHDGQRRIDLVQLGRPRREELAEHRVDRASDRGQGVARRSFDITVGRASPRRVHRAPALRRAHRAEPGRGRRRQATELRDLTHRPRAERLRLLLSPVAERRPVDPRGVVDLGGVEARLAVDLGHHHRADLVLHHAVVHDRAIGEVGDGQAHACGP